MSAWTNSRRGVARVLIHGLQSSGASYVAVLAAQGKDTLAVIDLWNPERAPLIRHSGAVVLKTTAGPVPFSEQRERFRPDAQVLVVRHPVRQIATLSRESFRDYALPIEEKLVQFDLLFADRRSDFDLVLRYEDAAGDPRSAARRLGELGLPMPDDVVDSPRSVEEIVRYARAESPWCEQHWRTRWGTGRYTSERQDETPEINAEAMTLAEECCPALLDYYGYTS